MKSCFLLLFATLCAKIPCTKSQAGNVIAGVRATQSTTGAHFADASNAIDGNKDSRFRHSSCSRTRRQSRPWWRVDLENHYRVYVVSITSAKSRRCGRLNGAEIRIGDTLENNGNSNTLMILRFWLVPPTQMDPALCPGTFRSNPASSSSLHVCQPGIV
ncbi:fucolectin-like isoform X3 [Hypanus sabinus]|uniref:fucolectin-like isoform X3 n=1 Tax=Hypanus sabinus TaxID=79690 RepID=UPI0028C42C8F|nr:fucolectin-like isoform X3 [Hypanus sabinus]